MLTDLLVCSSYIRAPLSSVQLLSFLFQFFLTFVQMLFQSHYSTAICTFLTCTFSDSFSHSSFMTSYFTFLPPPALPLPSCRCPLNPAEMLLWDAQLILWVLPMTGIISVQITLTHARQCTRTLSTHMCDRQRQQKWNMYMLIFLPALLRNTFFSMSGK